MGPHRFKTFQDTGMASTSCSTSRSHGMSDVEWLYPDLLSEEGLIHILKQRYIKAEGTDLEKLDKESLVELYNRYILPLPQRKFRNNRHGRELTKRQILYAKKRKISLDEEDNSSVKKPRNSTFQDTPGSSRGMVSNVNGTNSLASRLKPPPSSKTPEKKVVQLAGSNKVSSSGGHPSSQSPSDVNKKVVKLKSPGGDDRPVTKKQKLNENAKISPSQKGINKITWP